MIEDAVLNQGYRVDQKESGSDYIFHIELIRFPEGRIYEGKGGRIKGSVLGSVDFEMTIILVEMSTKQLDIQMWSSGEFRA